MADVYMSTMHSSTTWPVAPVLPRKASALVDCGEMGPTGAVSVLMR